MFDKYTEFDIEVPETLKNVRKTKIKLPYHVNSKSEERILLVFDSVNNSDYTKKKMLSGLLGNFFETVDKEAKKLCGKPLLNHNVFTINLNYVSAAGGTEADADTEEESEEVENQERLNEDLNKKRVLEFFKKIKPTKVITFGRKSFQIFNQHYKDQWLINATWTNLQGVPVDIKVGKHECKLIPLLNPNWLCTYQDSRDPYLIGYFIRTWANAMVGKTRFNMGLQPEDIKIQVVDTIKKFDKMLSFLYKAKSVAIDTETDNLNRIDNRIVIIQFSVAKKNAFVLPLFHFETPFNKKELNYIVKKLREYFLTNENEYHLYANANFDIPVIRVGFGFPFYKTPIWDVQAGEYCFHPNTYVSTEHGKIKIGELVDMQKPPKVWSMNTKTNELELKDILAKSRHENKKRMVKVSYDGGSVVVTEDHKLWSNTRGCYIEARDIQPEEEVVVQI